MRDNGNGREAFGLGSGSGVVKVTEWSRTEHQVPKHQSFASGVVWTKGDHMDPKADAPATMRLAEPPAWAQRDDLPCTQLVPKGNAKDVFDTNDRKVARALCAACPVRQACLDDAMEFEEGLGPRSRYMVRGGYTPRERGLRAQRLDM